jgi:four helix bundle protein
MVTRKEDERGKKEGGAGRSTRGFRRLIAWQQTMELASRTYSATRAKRLPPWMEGQVMGAALSVPYNIAEGYTRGGLRDYLRFLDIARASLAELESHLHFMVENDLLAESPYGELDRKARDVGNILVALMRSLSRKVKDGSWNRVSEATAEYLFTGEDDPLLPPSSDPLPRVEV